MPHVRRFIPFGRPSFTSDSDPVQGFFYLLALDEYTGPQKWAWLQQKIPIQGYSVHQVMFPLNQASTRSFMALIDTCANG